jgi:hypothetical protein
LTVRLQEHFSEEVETRNTRRQLLQTGRNHACVGCDTTGTPQPACTAPCHTSICPELGVPQILFPAFPDRLCCRHPA